MKRGKKIFLAILAGILAVVAICWVIWFIGYINLPEMDVSEVPLGMEWGMSRDEVKEIVAQHPEYSFSKGEGFVIYNVVNYQGIDGLTGQLVLGFDENDELANIHYLFRSVYRDGGMCTTDAMEIAYKSSNKYFAKICEAPHFFAAFVIEHFTISDGHSRYWIGEKSLISVLYDDDRQCYISYSPVDSDPEFVEMLRDPFADT